MIDSRHCIIIRRSLFVTACAIVLCLPPSRILTHSIKPLVYQLPSVGESEICVERKVGTVIMAAGIAYGDKEIL